MSESLRVYPLELHEKYLSWNEFCRGFHSAIEFVNQLPPPKPKWIPVAERLPKDGEFVLLTICRLDKKYNQNPFISVGYIGWNQRAWWCAHDGDCDTHNVDVLAWMPLPEPYRGE